MVPAAQSGRVLFRLSDEGLKLYNVGGDLSIDIMGMSINGKPSGRVISHHESEQAAKAAWDKLPEEEKARTLSGPAV